MITKTRRTFSFSVVMWVMLFVASSHCGAHSLYTLNVTGELLTVDVKTGFTTQISAALGPGSWNGLAASPLDPNVLFAINNPRPATLADPQFSRLVRINLDDGEPTLFPFFDDEVLGRSDIFSWSVAISPSEPNVAIVAGGDFGFPPEPFLYRVDTTTGEVIETAKPLVDIDRVETLTFGPDGSTLHGTLFGTNQDGELVTIDPQSATATVVGDPGLTNFLTGLAFDPDDGILFAIDGLGNDRLVILDAVSGALIGNVGPLGISGPEGLAFVPGLVANLDCNDDARTDVADLACSNGSDTTRQLLAQLRLLAGDLDGQNGVEFADFLILSSNFGRPLNRYVDGDIDDDGKVAFADFLELSANFGQSLSAFSIVPEPSGFSIVTVILAASLACFRSRRV